MELQVRQEYINCWDKAYSTCIQQEETMEMIVPDAYSDILQVLDAEGMVLLQKKETLPSCAQLQGCIKTDMIYTTDQVGEVCCMEAIIPFQTDVESANIMQNSKVMVKACVQKVDVHPLNPRKVLIKVNFILDVDVYTPKSQSICAGVQDAEEHDIEQKVGEYESEVTIGTMEKTFHYSDFVSLPAGHPKVKEMMKIQADSFCSESKIIGRKVVVKGEVVLHILYKTMEDTLHCVAIPVPFSQIMEHADIDEDTYEDLNLVFQNLKCQLTNDETQSFSVELELMAQCHFSKVVQMPMLLDSYSTSYDMMEETKEYPVVQVMDEGCKTQENSEKVETSMAVKDILDVKVRPVQHSQSVVNGTLTMQADMEVFILFETEQGEINSLHRRMQCSHETPAEASMQYKSESHAGKNPTASVYSEGMELMFTVEFSWKAMKYDRMLGLEKVDLGEPKEKNSNCPSVTVRTVKEGDTLWNIAKEYGTTQENIAQANALPTMDLYPGQMLIIPKMREKMPVER